ncbi:alcohol dehydrogenase [candidate division TA06 bacterium DG_24]|uniref:alcohol dehydrogenase n=3 Tax=Bacteria division TA06 TaxID=1156500 RepID=A0A0S8JLM9_UNCT6|nr:MAG: alcohol dehydrogenase [candidate division TA06 bacterium DG_24]KPK69269.1 MAG: alcohol dehydrogenase [candidate division TA06 bacterium SM23_40]KPL09749.1 MAG: alcohol dehydrogenase [candidate division TA06 bacterium SM1_40]
MKAMILEQPRPIGEHPLQLVDLPAPEPGVGEVQVRVHVCGICHTDLHTVEGELPLLGRPLVIGHQVVGTVEKRGKGTTRFSEGDRVGLAWLASTCGKCRFCLSGRENLCPDARFTGYDVDGGYAEYTVAKEAFAYRLPDGFADEQAAPLLCAGIIGFRALRLSEIQPGSRLGLYGFGASAHVAIQVAVHWRCEVYVFTRSPAHQDLARSLGATWVGRAEMTPPEKLDSAIIFAPAGELVLDALRVLERGGTLALAGIYSTPVPALNYTEHLYYERTVRSVTAATRQDGEELLRLAGEIPIETEIERFPLHDANRALELLKASRINGAGVLTIP